MDTGREDGKRMLLAPVFDDEDMNANEDKKKKRGSSSKRAIATDGSVLRCQVENCFSDMADAKPYHRRHKVCIFHAKAPAVLVFGLQRRFCQQCSRFHELSEFDDAKRSCRSRLAGHNERRRKNALDY